jgi:hypothetical protein
VYIRPYIGGGLNISRVSVREINLSETKVGGQGFAGAEFTVKDFPKLSFGGDLGVHNFGYGSGFMLGVNILYYFK